MNQIFAHVTSAEAPSGLLLFVAGVAVGALAMRMARHFRVQ